MERQKKRDPYGLTGTLLAQRYYLEELVGIGGMSVVYRARHVVTTATVAVKVLKPDLALAQPEMVEIFLKEAKATVGLDHPYIVRVTDAALAADGLPFLVMEWLAGRTLEAELRQKGPLPVDQVALLLDQIAEALAHAHARGLVHRDVKPSNLMLLTDHRGEPMVKILDFGIAKALAHTADARVSRAMGTWHYASPEQFRLGASIDHRSDIYSLGVVTYQMLTGRLPFEAESVERIIYGHLHEAPPAPRLFRPDLSGAVEEVLLRALAKNPEDRFSSALEMARAFRQAVGVKSARLRLRCEEAISQTGIAGALIYVDGRYVGRTDATGEWEIEGLSPRAHLLEVESARHHPWRGSVHLEPGEERTLRITLTPQRVGSVIVHCAVAQAEVLLDGERVGVTDERGSCLLERIPAGQHRITVRHPWYVLTRVECTVVPGEIASLMLSLRRRRLPGWRGLRLAWTRRESASPTPDRRVSRPASADVPPNFQTIADAVTAPIAPSPTTQKATRILSLKARSGQWLAASLVLLGLAGLALWWRAERTLSPRPEPPSPESSSRSVAPERASPPPAEAPLVKRSPEDAASVPPRVRRSSPVAAPPTPPSQTGSASEATPVKEPSARVEETASPALTVAEHVRLGNEHFAAHRYEEALREYVKARERDPANPDIYYLIGLVHERRGEYEAAWEAFQRCTSGPYATVARNHLKMLEKKRKKPKEPSKKATERGAPAETSFETKPR